MEAFQLLSRGGLTFDKRRFKHDVQLFIKSSVDKAKRDKYTPSLSNAHQLELPSDLDFFKYAPGGSGDTPAGKKKGRKKEEDDVDEDGRTAQQKKKRRKVEEGEGELFDRELDDVPPPPPRHRVTAKGTNVPDPIETFNALKDRYNVKSRLLANLTSYGFIHPTGIQSHGIPILLEGRDLAAISPTGTGKTLSFLLPIMSALGTPAVSSSKSAAASRAGVRALIIAPTRELAHQIHNECLRLAQGRKWRIVLFSKATASTLADKAVRSNIDVIIATPLRLVASLQNGTLELNNVRHLILDEADRLLDHEFLAQVEEIIAACTHDNVQKAVFSATLPAGVEKIAMGILRDPIRVVVGLKDTPLPLISQSLVYVADDPSKLPTLLTYLSQPFNPPVLIFTSTQPRASSLAEELVLNGVQNVDCLHAGLTKKEREAAVTRMRNGESWVMVSTEVMARGMDFLGVREVINYDFPTTVQSYVHRIGRTGRAGREGKAVTYFTNDDAPFLKPIVNVLLQSGSPVPDWMGKLPKPSKLKRRLMGKVARAAIVNPARKIGRAEAVKKRPDSWIHAPETEGVVPGKFAEIPVDKVFTGSPRILVCAPSVFSIFAQYLTALWGTRGRLDVKVCQGPVRVQPFTAPTH